MPDDDLDLDIAPVIDAPRAAIWRAWSDPPRRCPKPWTSEVRGFDMRPGGAFDTLTCGPSGEESPNPGVFLEIVPQQRIVISSALTVGWRAAVFLSRDR